MNVLKVGWIIFLVVLVTALMGGYRVYKRQDSAFGKHDKNQQELEKMKKEEQHKGEWEIEKKKDIETLKELAKHHGKWWFLHDIEDELGEEFNPRFLGIGKIKVQDQQDYIYISRHLDIEASYPELIKLFENLERERGFSVEDLKISAGSNAGDGRHLASFTLSSLEIKKKFLDELLEIEEKKKERKQLAESLILTPPWRDDQLLIVKLNESDPFVKEDAAKFFTIASSGGIGLPAVVAPIDLSPRYRLEGIIDFPKYRLVIIGPDYILKEGDWLEDMQVESIENQKVTLRQGEQEYFLAIPGFMDLGDGIKIKGVSEK